MSAKQAEGKITALYERLSRDDELAGDSSSIIHQKQYLEGYPIQSEHHGILIVLGKQNSRDTGTSSTIPTTGIRAAILSAPDGSG